jgi:hypothetical protein
VQSVVKKVWFWPGKSASIRVHPRFKKTWLVSVAAGPPRVFRGFRGQKCVFGTSYNTRVVFVKKYFYLLCFD